MLTTEKKKFADQMQEIIRMMEAGECTFHSFDAAPCARRVRQKNSTKFKTFYAVEFTLTVMTGWELES